MNLCFFFTSFHPFRILYKPFLKNYIFVDESIRCKENMFMSKLIYSPPDYSIVIKAFCSFRYAWFCDELYVPFHLSFSKSLYLLPTQALGCGE